MIYNSKYEAVLKMLLLCLVLRVGMEEIGDILFGFLVGKKLFFFNSFN